MIFALSWRALADDFTLTGRVVDANGQAVTGAKVSVEGSAFANTDGSGKFQLQLSKKITKIKEVRVLKANMRVENFDYQTDANSLTITMMPAPHFFQGQVLDQGSNPLAGVPVAIEGVSLVSTTDFRGFFAITLPSNLRVSKSTKFKISDAEIGPDKITVNEKYNFVLIAGLPVPGQAKAAPAPVAETTSVAVPPAGMVNVTVYDDAYAPLAGITFVVDGKTYVTNAKGQFVIGTEAVDVSKFSATGYLIATFDFDSAGNYVFIVVRSEGEAPTGPPVREPLDSLVLDYRGDFYEVINQLELRKQELAEKGDKIRQQMELIATKLGTSSANLKPQQRQNLTNYLKNLEDALIANDLAYEQAAEKSQTIVQKLKSTILEKDQTIEEVEEKRQANLRLLYIIAGVALLGLALAFAYSRIAKKIARQKQEIERQHKDLQQAYNQIKIISNTGQKITATLDFRNLVATVNQNLMNLIDSTVFGVGVVNEADQKIEFLDFIENGQKQTYHSEQMDDKRRFSVWSIKNQKEVIINDLATEWKKYLSVPNYTVPAEMPQSLIYLPLLREQRAIGVVTVQSNRKHAYSEMDVKILQALASYIAIALDNSNAYEIIKRRNKDITDSIRYAQTIQDAILPAPRLMQEILGENFVIFRPRDLVSGDFYWLNRVTPMSPMYNEEAALASAQAGERVYFALVDCTGHGVPGGFMSLVANHLLSEIVEIKRIQDPAQILEMLDLRVREALKQYEKVNDDGMDIALCQMARLMDDQGRPTGQTRIVFAGARRSLYYYQRSQTKLEVLKGDRASVGGLQRKTVAFTNHEITLQAGDTFYVLSDGMADQNNAERQKFSTRRLRDLLEANAELSLAKQKELLDTALDQHLQGTQQRDDITIIGVKL
ncbi:MAG: SpoIIE family protein phosphatase [Bernardetiaceae bacterium]|nr:SpoIIE family protein phosphatase [Bernardetiaceae bacterium]